MNLRAFESFSKIERLEKMFVIVTQKLHGSNASLWIEELDTVEKVNEAHSTYKDFVTSDNRFVVRGAKRTSFVTLDDDNFGFARFVHENRDVIAASLGAGTFFGEWCGPGINSGEGLKEKTLVLFDTQRIDGLLASKAVEGQPYPSLPARITTIPVLYAGSTSDIGTLGNYWLDQLRTNGSVFSPGFMRPEGIVIQVKPGNQKFKFVLDPEETGWRKGSSEPKVKAAKVDVLHLCQSKRLEKLLSRDEKYLRELPQSLSQIAKDYTADLESEGQFKEGAGGENERESLKGILFIFIKKYLAAHHRDALISGMKIENPTLETARQVMVENEEAISQAKIDARKNKTLVDRVPSTAMFDTDLSTLLVKETPKKSRAKKS